MEWAAGPLFETPATSSRHLYTILHMAPGSWAVPGYIGWGKLTEGFAVTEKPSLVLGEDPCVAALRHSSSHI